MSFNDAVEFTLVEETGGIGKTGYVNDPQDPGGETKFGIAARFHPGVDIKNLTREEAKQIYKEKYWDPYDLDQMHPALALVLFDMLVNPGQGAATKILQKCLGIRVDGRFGPITLRTTKDARPRQLTQELLQNRAYYYVTKVREKSYKIKYLGGWMKRCVNTAFAAGRFL